MSVRFRVWDIFNQRYDNSRFASTSDGVLLRQVDVVCWETVLRQDVEVDMGLCISDQLTVFENDIITWGVAPSESARVIFEDGVWKLREIPNSHTSHSNLQSLISTVGFNIRVTANYRDSLNSNT